MTMSRIVYVDGAYVPEEEAKISIFDRGFLMADGVYEVTSVLGGKLVDFEGHAVRLERSLTELGIAVTLSRDTLLDIHRELVKQNDIHDGLVYLQITRGSDGDRDFVFPNPETTSPTVVMFTQSKPGIMQSPASKTGLKVISIDDLRWGRRDIKTVHRTTQLFINLKNNKRLDALAYSGVKGFPVIAKVIAGKDNILKFYDGYGDRLGMRQDSLNRYGNAFIRTNYPEIDFIKKAYILK